MVQEVFKKILDLGLKKVIDQISVITVLLSLTSFGILFFFIPVTNALAIAVIVFGIFGVIETAYVNRTSKFHEFKKQYQNRQASQAELFTMLIRKIHKDRLDLIKPTAKEFEFRGLLFRHVESNKPVPTSIIAGPLCPKCKEGNVMSEPWLFFPWLTQYSCVCGFNRISPKSPDKLYDILSEHFNLPID